MSQLTSFLVGLMLWFMWGWSANHAGIKALSEEFWPIWITTFLMCVWYGSKHHFEKKG